MGDFIIGFAVIRFVEDVIILVGKADTTEAVVAGSQADASDEIGALHAALTSDTVVASETAHALTAMRAIGAVFAGDTEVAANETFGIAAERAGRATFAADAVNASLVVAQRSVGSNEISETGFEFGFVHQMLVEEGEPVPRP